MEKFYAGIGSRETPDNVQQQMTKISTFLESKGWCTRSGGAPSADDAFEKGVIEPQNKQILIPWNGFNGRNKGTGIIVIDPYTTNTYSELERIAKSFHPAWFRLSSAAQKLMTRNVPQVLGVLLKPADYSRFVVCYTSDGKASGGTGQAIRIANHYKIPVYNLFNNEDVIRLGEFLKTL